MLLFILLLFGLVCHHTQPFERLCRLFCLLPRLYILLHTSNNVNMVRFHVCLVTPQIARSKRLLVTGGCRQSTLLQPISIAGLLVKEVKAFLIFHRKPMILLRALSTTQFTAVWGVKDDAKPAHSCRVRALLVRL